MLRDLRDADWTRREGLALLAEHGLEGNYDFVPGSFCDGQYNLVIGGRKITGTAQRWLAPGQDHGGAVLAQAMLLVAGDAPGQRHPLVANVYKGMMVAPFDPSLIYCGGPTIPKARARLRAIRAEAEKFGPFYTEGYWDYRQYDVLNTKYLLIWGADPLAANRTYGGVAGGFEVHISEGYTHVDVLTAEDIRKAGVINGELGSALQSLPPDAA